MQQAILGLDSLAIPAQQRANGKGVAQAMHSRHSHPGRHVEPQLWPYLTEGSAHSRWVDRAAFIPTEPKQWPLRLQTPDVRLSLLHVIFEPCRQLWSEWDYAALGKLALVN